MLKEITETFRQCECLKDIIPFAGHFEVNKASILPLEDRLIKCYTDGTEKRYIKLKLLYTSPFSPEGDKDFKADTFFTTAATQLKTLFNQPVKAGDFEFISLEHSLSCAVEKATPSFACFFTTLTLKYLKERN